MIDKHDIENLWSEIYRLRERLDEAERLIEILRYQHEEKNAYE